MTPATFSRLVQHGVVVLTLLRPAIASAQRAGDLPSMIGRDSVTIAAGAHYKAGGFHESLFGGNYRELWTTPIRVPVLDLHTFAGGLKPVKLGGGNQTRSLHLIGADGVAYVFRSVDKDRVPMPPMWKNSILESLAIDQGSAAHPAGALMASRIMDATGILHVTPVMAVMPNDPGLGKFQKEFAGLLGEIEIDPSGPKHDSPGFGGALEIIDSDTLLARLNRDAATRVDVRELLAARLTDMLINDWDRGPSQWKWARFEDRPGAMWEPIPRDRDKAFITYSGFFPSLMRGGSIRMIKFGPAYGELPILTGTSILFDGRLLGGLEKPVWDSVALALQGRLTDSVIDAAVQAMPPEYRATAPTIASDLRVRRDSLPAQANKFYRYLADVVDIHGTDSADRATITHLAGDQLEVRLQSGDRPPYFDRHFDGRETHEIRVYLHGGDDRAIVVGDAPTSISLRVIGGNGINTLADSSHGGGKADLYDVGTVAGVNYGPDTLFDRRPLIQRPTGPVDPIRDHGVTVGPGAGLLINRDYGIMPDISLARTRYGFDHYPYSSRVRLDAQYSFLLDRYRLGLTTDSRDENSAIHYTTLSRLSELEVIAFHGYGNSTPGLDTAYFAVHQRQALFKPAIALALGESTDLSLGPVLQYSVTASAPGNFVADSQPYGFGHSGTFGEASLQLSLHHDNRTPRRHAREGTVLDIDASFFPAVWDVRSAFEEVDASGAVYMTLPVPTHPAFALRGGAKKLFGTFPFQDAAFIGGTTNLRTVAPERLAGDESVYGTAELRIPVLQFKVLVPLDVGLLGTVDYARVYVNGVSDGGWHNAAGAGFWIGFRETTIDVRLMQADEVGRSGIALRMAVPTGSPR